MHKVCGWKCGLELTNVTKEKSYKKETARMKRDFKANDRSHQIKLTQTACNAYIRDRDKNEPCISCGTTKPDIQYCAGHFKTVGSNPALRFNPLNIHKQCNRYCNMALSGNVAAYRERLIEKIGLDYVLWIEGPQDAQNWCIDDLKEIRQYFKEQTKLLTK